MEDGRGYPMGAIRVCIDSYGKGGDIKGRIFSRMAKGALPFGNLGEMLLQADELFDRCGYPQSFQEKRDFGGAKSKVSYARPKPVLSDGEIRREAGECRTVDILVKSRRKTGWQGCVMEEGMPVWEFQSEMGLLRHLGLEAQDHG